MGGEGSEEAMRKLRKGVRANETVVRIGEDAKSEWLRKRNPLLASLDATGPSKVMVCEKGACRELSGTEVDELMK